MTLCCASASGRGVRSRQVRVNRCLESIFPPRHHWQDASRDWKRRPSLTTCSCPPPLAPDHPLLQSAQALRAAPSRTECPEPFGAELGRVREESGKSPELQAGPPDSRKSAPWRLKRARTEFKTWLSDSFRLLFGSFSLFSGMGQRRETP